MEVALYRPEIPPNTGNIARLCVCTGIKLHIIGEPAFSLEDKDLKRAGLDYWHLLRIERHESWAAFRRLIPPDRIVLVSKFGRESYADIRFRSDEVLVFGCETSGLPPEVHQDMEASGGRIVHIPMKDECRSLNLSNSVALVVYEGLRQTGFAGLSGARTAGR